MSVAAKTYRGVTYYPNYLEARAISDQHAGSRVVFYDRGYAVQGRISGPYWNEAEQRFQ